MKNSILKFSKNASFFKCPICNNSMKFENNSIKCENNHSFDIARKGYINFLSNRKPQLGYDKTFFENRNIILSKGYYDHICSHIKNILLDYNLENIIDIGCGEGFYAKELYNENTNFFAFDLSKEAINIAARGNNMINFFVGDILSIPILDSKMDCILNIYTPANYPEFKRILKDNGIIIKVIPGLSHLKELRYIVKADLKREAYNNENVIQCFKEHCNMLKIDNIEKTYPLSKELLPSFLNMTPLMFDKDKNKFDYSTLKYITISATILIGKIK